MIELKQVSKKYGDTIAVNKVSFKVEEGENLVLLGTSGCGKTTTLKMINRLIEPDGGQILINEADVLQQNPENLRRGIGYVMQNIGLFPHYTIEENISVVPKLLKWEKKKTADRIYDLLKKLHLPENILQLFPSQLSGGQQQRIGLARALVANPAILLMDEPFGALDNVTRSKIQEEFKELEELKRKTIVMVTHDVLEAFELADRICLMDRGEIKQIGTPKDLLFKPANDFARKFLDGQRLALEFKVIKISDLWPNLPNAANNDAKALNPAMTIWSVMEMLSSKGTTELSFVNKNDERKVVNFNELSKAFNEYKKHLQP
ncbi:ABC transporter ATP-binding protein [Pedobacter sp. Leaf194]|uniref:ABC transporter ATP-binding protein n=1 Tax=Pedobacter sp. Leaf194 TaxID=1736297 RepID=UPI0007025205|nr:ATP-binding cassette domain-containing protein [Pedobacter sp. Leaf194]KQS32441.1 glycine/betaine ABC transporter ATP-binding protein [Pedobacter sp. Leaf194]